MCAGEGILTGADGSIYEGSFYDNKKHGEGTQLYRCFNNLRTYIRTSVHKLTRSALYILYVCTCRYVCIIYVYVPQCKVVPYVADCINAILLTPL